MVKQGEAVAVLRDEVSNLRPDLLVFGTHGRVGLSHLLIGSVAEAILNQPSCDVLVVKAW
ncbi:MAG: universal stress protein [Pseudomonadota bacterium]|nr:universal stress protein [Alphaproteobacteria bacterium]MEC7302975.1 universal stress protein [Pseudomonadota bacterium]MEC9186262.1 universal stress protein [Pseudomonadota bacterium]